MRLSVSLAFVVAISTSTITARAAGTSALTLSTSATSPVLGVAPVLDSPCLRLHPAAKEVTGGQGFLADQLCSRAYVLPPMAGTVSVAQLSATPNVQQCPLILGLHTQVDAALQEIQGIQAQIDVYLTQIGELDAQLDALGDQLATTSVASSTADSTLLNDTNDQTVLMTQLQSAQNAFSNCVVLATASSDCATLQAGVAAAQTALSTFTANTLAPAQVASTAADAAYASALAAYDDVLDQLSDALDPVVDLVTQLTTVDTTVLSTYETYAALEGANGSLVFSVPWTALVDSYRASNLREPWTWGPIPLDSATLAASAVLGGDPTSIPALLSATLPGADAGIDVLSGGTETAAITLSLVGACPYFPTGNPDAPDVSVDQKGLAAYVSANLTYTYPVEVMTSFAKLLGVSPLANKLKGVGIDPLGPTLAATLVQATVSGQAFEAEMADQGAQHAALLTTLKSSSTQLQRAILKPPSLPVARYTKVEQTGTLTFVP